MTRKRRREILDRMLTRLTSAKFQAMVIAVSIFTVDRFVNHLQDEWFISGILGAVLIYAGTNALITRFFSQKNKLNQEEEYGS